MIVSSLMISIALLASTMLFAQSPTFEEVARSHGTLIVVNVLHDQLIIGADSRETQSGDRTIDTAHKIYPVSQFSAAALTGNVAFSVNGKALSIPNEINRVIAARKAIFSKGTLTNQAHAIARVVTDAISGFLRGIDKPGVYVFPVNICQLALFGWVDKEVHAYEITFTFDDAQKKINATMTDSPIRIRLNEGYMLSIAYGSAFLHHQLVRGTSPTLETVRADPVIQRYRQMKTATKTPGFSREDAIHLIDITMEATTKYWNQFYPPPVGVGGPVDIALISAKDGFSWHRKK